MARLRFYPEDNVLHPSDHILGTDEVGGNGATRVFTIQSLQDYIGGNLGVTVVDSVEQGVIPVGNGSGGWMPSPITVLNTDNISGTQFSNLSESVAFYMDSVGNKFAYITTEFPGGFSIDPTTLVGASFSADNTGVGSPFSGTIDSYDGFDISTGRYSFSVTTSATVPLLSSGALNVVDITFTKDTMISSRVITLGGGVVSVGDVDISGSLTIGGVDMDLSQITSNRDNIDSIQSDIGDLQQNKADNTDLHPAATIPNPTPTASGFATAAITGIDIDQDTQQITVTRGIIPTGTTDGGDATVTEADFSVNGVSSSGINFTSSSNLSFISSFNGVTGETTIQGQVDTTDLLSGIQSQVDAIDAGASLSVGGVQDVVNVTLGEGISLASSSPGVAVIEANLSELSDVDVTNIANRDILFYDSSTSGWLVGEIQGLIDEASVSIDATSGSETVSNDVDTIQIATRDTNQTISGGKTFTGNVDLTNAAISGLNFVDVSGDLPAGRISGLSVTAAPVIFTATSAATDQDAVETQFYADVPTEGYEQGQIAYLFYDSTVQSGILVETLLYVGDNQTTPAATTAADWHDITTMLPSNLVLHTPDTPLSQNSIPVAGVNGILGDSAITQSIQPGEGEDQITIDIGGNGLSISAGITNVGADGLTTGVGNDYRFILLNQGATNDLVQTSTAVTQWIPTEGEVPDSWDDLGGVDGITHVDGGGSLTYQPAVPFTGTVEQNQVGGILEQDSDLVIARTSSAFSGAVDSGSAWSTVTYVHFNNTVSGSFWERTSNAAAADFVQGITTDSFILLYTDDSNWAVVSPISTTGVANSLNISIEASMGVTPMIGNQITIGLVPSATYPFTSDEIRIAGDLTVTGDTSGINRVAVVDRTASDSVSNLQFEIIASGGTPSGAGFITFRKE